jgi:hypothetical protein
MALASAEEFAQRNQLTLTAAQQTAVADVVAEVEDAVKALVHPTVLEAATATSHVLDAPWGSQKLYLPLRPVRAVTSLYVRRDAKGDPSLFTSDYLKTAYTDYRLVIDQRPEGWSKYGTVEILNASFWGASLVRPYGRLASDVVNVPGAVLVNYTYGYTVVPPRVRTAVYQAVAMILARRKSGIPVVSASLNGASYSGAAPFTATAAVHSPDVLASLYGLYDPLKIGGGS